MAFQKKTWKDRLVEFAGRRILTNVSTGQSQTFDVTRSEGQISQAGDAFSAANMNNLEQRIGDAFTKTDSDITTLEGKMTPHAVYEANMSQNTPVDVIKWINANTTEFGNSSLGGACILVAPVIGSTRHAPYFISFSRSGGTAVFGFITRGHDGGAYVGGPEAYIFNYYVTGGADPVLKKLGNGALKVVKVANFGGSTSSQTFNCTNIPNYKNLTVNNFAHITTYAWGGTLGTRHANFQVSPSLSYNAATGILTLSPTKSSNDWNDRVDVSGYINCYYVE